MKQILSLLVIVFLSFGVVGNVFAGGIADHFKLTLLSQVRLGQYMDLEVEVLDSDNKVVEDYNNSILVFSETDVDASFYGKLSENYYEFTTNDKGKVKFYNAFKFSKVGLQDIYVYDLDNEKIFGFKNIMVNNDITKKSKSKLIKQLIISKGKLLKKNKEKYIKQIDDICSKLNINKINKLYNRLSEISYDIRHGSKYKDILDYLEAKIGIKWYENNEIKTGKLLF